MLSKAASQAMSGLVLAVVLFCTSSAARALIVHTVGSKDSTHPRIPLGFCRFSSPSVSSMAELSYEGSPEHPQSLESGCPCPLFQGWLVDVQLDQASAPVTFQPPCAAASTSQKPCAADNLCLQMLMQAESGDQSRSWSCLRVPAHSCRSSCFTIKSQAAE